MEYFLQGLTMGLAYVAPIGVQNLFVINSALSQKLWRALITALIVIFFDITLALACFLGIGIIMEHYRWLQMLIVLLGSVVIIYIGIGLLRERLTEIKRDVPPPSILSTIYTACVVTWFNPHAIIDGTMVLGAFNAALPPSESLAFILGVALASCLWFSGLTVVISIFAKAFNSKVLRIINIVCGVVIIFYGLKLLYGIVG